MVDVREFIKLVCSCAIWHTCASVELCHFVDRVLQVLSTKEDSTYNCKTQKNATLTGHERQGYVQLKVS